jgi:hypothetical protein
MATDLYKRVLFDPDGEALDFTDVNDAQTFLESRLCDQVLEKLVPGPELNDFEAGTNLLMPGAHGANAPTSAWAYALTSGGAYPRKGSGNDKVQIAPGTLFQKIAAADGSAPTFLPFTFAGTEEVAIAAGDATNPRVDLVQMKLELVSGDPQTRHFEDAVTRAPSSQSTNKKRRVQCTLTVKQGTPGASPTYPTLDAGCVAIAGVVVPATWAAVAAPLTIDSASADSLVVHDQRMPLGTVRPHHVYPPVMVGNWTLSSTRATIASSSSADIYAFCPVGSGIDSGGVGRIVAVLLAADNANTVADPSIVRYLSGPDVGITQLNTMALGGSPAVQLTAERRHFEERHLPGGGGPTINANASGMGPPVWTNGRRALEVADGVADHFSWGGAAVRVDGAASPVVTVHRVTFFVADGL